MFGKTITIFITDLKNI